MVDAVAVDPVREVDDRLPKVELLGHDGALEFAQSAEGLRIILPAQGPNACAYAFRVSGLNLK